MTTTFTFGKCNGFEVQNWALLTPHVSYRLSIEPREVKLILDVIWAIEVKLRGKFGNLTKGNLRISCSWLRQGAQIRLMDVMGMWSGVFHDFHPYNRVSFAHFARTIIRTRNVRQPQRHKLKCKCDTLIPLNWMNSWQIHGPGLGSSSFQQEGWNKDANVSAQQWPVQSVKMDVGVGFAVLWISFFFRYCRRLL